MTEMRKLKVIVLEDSIDTVVRSLGEAGIVQFADMREKLADWKGILVPHVVSTETSAKCSNLLNRVESLSGLFGMRTEESPSRGIPLMDESSEAVLADIESKLAAMPAELMTKCLSLDKRISLLLETLRVKPIEVVEEQAVPDRSPEEILVDVEHELSEIEHTMETLGLRDEHVLLDRIGRMASGERTEFARKLAELRRAVIGSEKIFGDRLLVLKRRISIVKESVEAETKLTEIRDGLLDLRVTLQREKQVAEEQQKFVRSVRTVYFEAWVPGYQAKTAEEIIYKAAGGNSIVSNEEPEQDEKVPVVLSKVPSYETAFEKLALAFGYPSQGDVNPIHALAVTFPLLFGIMFADVGQGLLLALIGVAFTFVRKRLRIQNTGEIVRSLLTGGEMFIFLGISAMLFGFIFGEFFGPSGVIHPVSLGRIGPFQIGGFEPMHEPMKMLKFAVLVGAIHMSTGLLFRFVNEIRHKHLKHAPVPICWLWLLWGSLFMWAYWGGISNIPRWFAEGNLMLAGLILLPLILIFLFTSLAEGFMEGVGFSVEVFAETLSHSLSYSRLMALGLIHSAMNYLFLVLGGVEHGYFPLVSIPIVAMGTILVMIIEGLVVFVHTLRLHWVEWFSEFNTGDGIRFEPFKYS